MSVRTLWWNVDGASDRGAGKRLRVCVMTGEQAPVIQGLFTERRRVGSSCTVNLPPTCGFAFGSVVDLRNRPLVLYFSSACACEHRGGVLGLSDCVRAGKTMRAVRSCLATTVCSVHSEPVNVPHLCSTCNPFSEATAVQAPAAVRSASAATDFECMEEGSLM
jgi:hypothetical protein